MTIKPGAFRFNTDSLKLEVFRGEGDAGQWEEIVATSSFTQTGGTRGILMGGYYPVGNHQDEIQYINIETSGNALLFGELTVSDENHVNSGIGDRTRGISCGGSKSPGVYTADMEFITMASTGNAVDFGADLTAPKYGMGSGGNSTRGLLAGGNTPGGTKIAQIDYVTIQSTGVAAQDFGDLTQGKEYIAVSMCSPTRSLFGGGNTGSRQDEIDCVTTSTLGNAADFGDLRHDMSDHKGGITSNSVRGINMGGYAAPTNVATIEYFTLATFGNYKDFGDLPGIRSQGGGVSNSIRCVLMGAGSPAYSSDIEYVTIATTGNSTDFGNLYAARGYSACCSNGHGGL